MRLAKALPQARLQFVEDAGHHLPRRAPDAVAEAIVTFLDADGWSADYSASADVNTS